MAHCSEQRCGWHGAADLVPHRHHGGSGPLAIVMLLAALQQLMRQHPREWIGFVVGLEGSAWIHLILDGDPWPQEWSNKRQR